MSKNDDFKVLVAAATDGYHLKLAKPSPIKLQCHLDKKGVYTGNTQQGAGMADFVSF
jgi:hypothetical protein